MINVSKAIRDPRLSQQITIYRKSGEWNKGRFEQTEQQLSMLGVVSIAKSKDIEMIPEGDRVGGEIVIHTLEKIFVTHNSDNNKGTSDEILWDGERYKIYSVSPYMQYGYYKAIAMRKLGG